MARKRIEMTDAPVDPGGQPDTRTGQPLELGFFAWNIRGGMTMSKATLRNNDRERDFWKWPNSRKLVEHAEQIGIGYFLSTGNEGDLEFSDFCDYFVADPRVRIIAGYVESIRDGDKFRAAAAKAASVATNEALGK